MHLQFINLDLRNKKYIYKDAAFTSDRGNQDMVEISVEGLDESVFAIKEEFLEWERSGKTRGFLALYTKLTS
jgi:hypothetical protein